MASPVKIFPPILLVSLTTEIWLYKLPNQTSYLMVKSLLWGHVNLWLLFVSLRTYSIPKNRYPNPVHLINDDGPGSELFGLDWKHHQISDRSLGRLSCLFHLFWIDLCLEDFIYLFWAYAKRFSKASVNLLIFIPINQPVTVAGNGIVLIFFGEIMIL